MSSADAAPAALATRGLSAGYGDVPVLRGIDVTVRAGQLVAVVGPNGAGKTTLLKAILGLAKVMGGQVLADGADITGRPLEKLARLGIGYVPQVDDVFDSLKVSENLHMGGYLLDKAGRAAALTDTVLNDQVRALADHGHAVLLVEQRAQAALKLADHAYVLVQGRVAMAAPAAEVLASPEMAEVFLGGRVPQQGGTEPGGTEPRVPEPKAAGQ
jgi:branched-chain amino acid transport system ATP-binding protein